MKIRVPAWLEFEVHMDQYGHLQGPTLIQISERSDPPIPVSPIAVPVGPDPNSSGELLTNLKATGPTATFVSRIEAVPAKRRQRAAKQQLKSSSSTRAPASTPAQDAQPGVVAFIRRQPDFRHSLEQVARMFPPKDGPARKRLAKSLLNFRYNYKKTHPGTWSADVDGFWTWTASP